MPKSSTPAKAAQFAVGNYQLQNTFPGYHAREDPTLLAANIMVSPSQNVMINTAGLIATVPGYILDGAGSTVIDSGIVSNFDFLPSTGNLQNLRAGFQTAAGNTGKLQFRFQSGTTVTWIDLMSSLTSINLSFAPYFDTTELKQLCIWADGSSNLYEWNGAVATFASATTNTLTLQGSLTWAQLGFYTTRNMEIIINGVTYTYTGGYGTTTLTGVTPDPSLAGIAVGTPIFQAPITTAFSAMTNIPADFMATVVGRGNNNQLYVGSSASNLLYISKNTSYQDFSFDTPRTVGQGDIMTLSAAPRAFINQEVHGDDTAYDMYIAEGTNTWGVVRVNLAADLSSETLSHYILKTSSLQGAFSNRMVSKMKNHIIYIGNDNVLNIFGYLSFEYVPSIQDLSYPIIDDMLSYDFTGGSVFYNRNYIYVAVPKSGLVRIYNMTNQTQEQYSAYDPTEQISANQPWFWEAPVTYPISGFYIVNGQVYGHSANASESYQLFTGGSFNGQNITANATFAFNDYGDRTANKASDEIWVEGYIKQNTILNVSINGNLDSFENSQTVTVDGSDNTIVAYGSGAHSLGKNPLGSQPLGGASTNLSTKPAWFHVAKTYPEIPSYLEQLSFQTNGVDLQWELMAFGTDAKFTNEGNNDITQ
jgi:hypothetical protein